MKQDSLELAINTIDRIIEQCEKDLKSYIEQERWLMAGDKESYMAGLKQAKAVLEISK